MRLCSSLDVAVMAVVLAGCESGPPIKTASGELIDKIGLEETFPLSSDVKESTLGGERLRSAVALMDKHRIFDLKGEYKASGVLDKGTLTIVVKPVAGAERRTTFKSCGHESVCAFFAEASANGVVDHTPVLCRNPVPCDKSRAER